MAARKSTKHPNDTLVREMSDLRRLIGKYPSDAADILLDTPFWHQEVKTERAYSREGDDTDGKKQGITVAFGPDSDAWFEVRSFDGERGDKTPPITHRFRSGFGGSNSDRVRTALLVLARAIDLENERKPDRP